MITKEDIKQCIRTFTKRLRNKKFILYYNTSSSVIFQNGLLKLYQNVIQDRLKKRFSNLEVKIKQREKIKDLVIFVKNVKKYEAKLLMLDSKKVKVTLLCVLAGNVDFVKNVHDAIDFALSSVFKPFKPVDNYFKKILGNVLKDKLNKTGLESVSIVYMYPKLRSCKLTALLSDPILTVATRAIFTQGKKLEGERSESLFKNFNEHLSQTYGINLHQFCITALTYPNHFIQLNSKNILEVRAMSDDVIFTVISSIWELLSGPEIM